MSSVSLNFLNSLPGQTNVYDPNTSGNAGLLPQKIITDAASLYLPAISINTGTNSVSPYGQTYTSQIQVSNADYALQMLFGGFGSSASQPPTDFTNFILAMRAALGRTITNTQTGLPDVGDVPESYLSFLNEYYSDLNIPSSLPQGGNAAEENALLTALSFAGLTAPTDGFETSFAAFLQTYATAMFQKSSSQPTTQNAGDGSTITDFINSWRQFMTGTAVLTDSAKADAGYTNLNSYQSTFENAFPGAPPAAFQNFLNNFVQQQVFQYGYFLPSHFYNNFADAVNQAVIAARPSFMTGAHGDKVQVVLSVINLVILLIQSIQNIAEQQSNYLTFLTNYQKSYTQTANNIYIFKPGDGSIYSGGGDAMDQANAQGQAWGSSLRDFRSLLEDAGKQMEANINQTNEAVNQQSNLITSIFSQFSTIMQSITQAK